MSFEHEYGNEAGMKISPDMSNMRECKPDYEKRAAKLKKKLDSTQNLQDALFYFMSLNNANRFRKISSLAELIGGLAIIQKEQVNHYEEILSLLEKEK